MLKSKMFSDTLRDTYKIYSLSFHKIERNKFDSEMPMHQEQIDIGNNSKLFFSPIPSNI